MVSCLVLLCGCASIVDLATDGGPNRTVRVNSNPPGTEFSIYNKDGKLVDGGITPASISLRRDHGYFSGEDYRVNFSHPGYTGGDMYIHSTLNGWYYGNLAIGGAVGFLALDPATGAMWTLSSDNLTCNLASNPMDTTQKTVTTQIRCANCSAGISVCPADGVRGICPRCGVLVDLRHGNTLYQ